MTLWGAVIYGAIQGIAEFLPISSSGHLALAQNFGFFGTSGEGNDIRFNVVLHFGTLAAVFIVYRKDVYLLIKSFLSLLKRVFSGDRSKLDEGEITLIYLCFASMLLVPAALLSDKIEWISKSSMAIGIFLIINGVILWLSEKLSNGKASPENTKPINVFCIGAFQLLGVLPGISRSGSTITGGLLNGFDRQNAVRFSFLLSVPAILGAGIMELKGIENNVGAEEIYTYIVGAVSAAAVGIASIKALQYLAKEKSFLPFTFYSVGVGCAAILYDVIK